MPRQSSVSIVQLNAGVVMAAFTSSLIFPNGARKRCCAFPRRQELVRAVDLFAELARGKGGQIDVGKGVIAQFETERVGGAQGVRGGIVHQMTVTEHRRGGFAIGVILVESGEYREDIFQRFARRVVEGERDELSRQVYLRNIDVIELRQCCRRIIIHKQLRLVERLLLGTRITTSGNNQQKDCIEKGAHNDFPAIRK